MHRGVPLCTLATGRSGTHQVGVTLREQLADRVWSLEQRHSIRSRAQIVPRATEATRAGVRTSEYGRDYRIGYGVGVLEQGRRSAWTPNDGRARCSRCRSRGQAPTSACSGRATVQW